MLSLAMALVRVMRAGSWFAEPEMIAEWIYNNPTWLWGTILVVLAAAFGGLGLLAVHRLVHIEVRRAHNELAGFLVAVISVTYAVLLAFIAVATWESFSHAQDIVDSEADYVGSIYRDTQGLPPEVGQSIRDDLEQYVTTVVNQEWPVQREGKTPDQGWAPLHKTALLHRNHRADHDGSAGHSG
jgi:hypothetical protein